MLCCGSKQLKIKLCFSAHTHAYRWRKLEGSDPSTFEMILKIQTLQKRLITKTEEVVERDLLIQEKEKLYVELKNILARQPGPEVAEQLSNYQANIREKNKQMKSMASELNTHQAQVRPSAALLPSLVTFRSLNLICRCPGCEAALVTFFRSLVLWCQLVCESRMHVPPPHTKNHTTVP